MAGLLQRNALVLARSLLACAVALSACGQAAAPSQPLVPYDAHEQRLFDDAIEPTAVGMSLDDPDHVAPAVDRLLRERAEVGDAVVRARVDTVTMKKEEREGHRVTFDLGIHVVDTLAGKVPHELAVHLSKKSSPSAELVEALGPALENKTFVVFVRRFEGPSGRPRYYAHFSPDTKEVVDAVKAAVIPP